MQGLAIDLSARRKKKSANIGQAGRDYNPKEQEQKTERQTDNRKREKEDK